MELAKVTSKSQITIPIAIRNALGIREGNEAGIGIDILRELFRKIDSIKNDGSENQSRRFISV